MTSSRVKAGSSTTPMFVILAVVACALAGCSSTSAERSPGSGGPKEVTPAMARNEISRICMKEPEKYFGVGKKTNKAHCDCFGSNVVKQLSKDEQGYVVRYHEIPSLSSGQYDQELSRCVDAAPVAPEKTATKKKS